MEAGRGRPDPVSKAFTKETDDSPEIPASRRPGSGLPPGASNYLTASGARRFREELERLTEGGGSPVGNPAGEHGGPERIRYLRELLGSAVVVRATAGSLTQVRFGARVAVRAGDGRTVSYRIVGVDEAEPDRGEISCISPIARALTNRRVGERIRLETPGGTEEMEILSIAPE